MYNSRKQSGVLSAQFYFVKNIFIVVADINFAQKSALPKYMHRALFILRVWNMFNVEKMPRCETLLIFTAV